MAGYVKCKAKGVRYREHPTRKHGIKPDRYYFIRYKSDGKDKEEAVGWASDGVTEAKATAQLLKLKESRRTGIGALTLAAQKENIIAEAKAKAAADAAAEREKVSFGKVWDDYRTSTTPNKKEKSNRTEEQLYRLWIEPIIADKPIKDVAPVDLERIKKNMADAGRAPRSVQYCLAVVRQVFNFARDHDLYHGISPTNKVRCPKFDNRRLRFLTQDEADNLLEALRERSKDVYHMAALSLDGGMRAGEIFNLTWSDVDFESNTLTLRKTKNSKTRRAPLISSAREILENRKKESNGSQLVFPSSKTENAPITDVSKTFSRVVNEIGLNDGILDRLHHVCFHTLRHTCASWMVQNGVPLIAVGKILGHSTTAMTERYSHLAPDHLREAINTLENLRGKTNHDNRPNRKQKPCKT